MRHQRPWLSSRCGQLQLFVGTIATLALVVAGIAGATVSGLPHLAAWQLVLVLLIAPAAELDILRVRYGHDNFSFGYGEAALVVGFSMAGAPWLVLLSGPGLLVLHVACGRGALKSIHNASAFVVSSSVAALVVGGTANWAPGVSRPGEAVVLLLAVTCFSVTSWLCTSAAVTIAQGLRLRRVLIDNARMSVLVWAGNVAAATVIVGLGERSPAALVAMPPVLILLFMAYKGRLSAKQERETWQQLELAAIELNVLDEREVVQVALRRAAQLFRCDAELVLLAGTRRGAGAYTLSPDGELCSRKLGDGDLSVDFAPTAYVELPDGGRQQAVANCLVAPLEGPRGRVGVLRLLFGGPVTLSSRERQVLSTFGHAVGTTLVNAELYEDVRAEASRQAHAASHDALTGLANRVLLTQRTTQALDVADRTTALLLLDLDHFKEINDTLGHAAGDVLLQHVATRLRGAGRPDDLVARLGGDEFAVLLTGLSSPHDAAPVAERVLALLRQPVDFQGLHLSIEASIGVACHPQDADSADELLRRADVAMYQAKADRGSWLRYDNLRDDSSLHRLSLVAELRRGLEDDEVLVHYQAQLDVETGQVVGAEALARWQHPQRGLLQPAAFVSVAEQSGLVRPFALRILDLAVAECATWQTPDRPVSVAVNVGARSLLDRQLPDDVAAVLARHGLPPDRLVLEITETTATSELEVVEEVLGRLRRLGVEISVDDFGTGYSSLAFLQRTAVHELKVDRSFVQGMLVSDNDLALVRATIQLAHSLGARAVAEGVESQALALALGSLDCDVLQGFHISRPVPAEAFRALLALRGAPAAPRSDGERHLTAVAGTV